jgi:hypothetical protein
MSTKSDAEKLEELRSLQKKADETSKELSAKVAQLDTINKKNAQTTKELKAAKDELAKVAKASSDEKATLVAQHAAALKEAERAEKQKLSNLKRTFEDDLKMALVKQDEVLKAQFAIERDALSEQLQAARQNVDALSGKVSSTVARSQSDKSAAAAKQAELMASLENAKTELSSVRKKSDEAVKSIEYLRGEVLVHRLSPAVIFFV